ncbi:MAG: helix-turn-helix domain-containing protein [Aminipila sp.]
MDFGERLRFLRQENSITQEELANAINVRRPAISGYETKNQQPDFARLILISNFFNVSIDYLLGKTDLPNYDRSINSSTSILPTKQKQLVDIYNSLNATNQGALLERAETLLEFQKKEESTLSYAPIEGA